MLPGSLKGWIIFALFLIAAWFVFTRFVKPRI